MKYKLTDRALRRIILQEIKKLAEIDDLGGDIPEPTPEQLAAIEAEEAEEAEFNSPPEARPEKVEDWDPEELDEFAQQLEKMGFVRR